jgi:transcriptional regulator with XRE-family HTH domain
MARAALGWGVRDLALEARVGTMTVSRFESGQANPIPATLAAIQRALEAAGIEFIPGGARLREQPAEAS